ncbi:polyprenyl synthetase family protein [Chloroflexota bacterium]
MSLPDPFNRYGSELEAELKSILDKSEPPLYVLMRYHMGWVDKRGCPQETSVGKRSRPTLCLLACEGVGGDWRSALPAAAAVELIHNFSLIHDDIQDRSPERRNRPAVWKIWGQAQGINAGDAMYTLAHLALFRLEERGVSPEKIIMASNILSQSSLQICLGQYLDINLESNIDIQLDSYLEMITEKTASLFECSLYLGSLLGTDSKAQISHLRSFGRDLGMAYQVRNDMLGIWEEKNNGKKSPCTDIRYKKKTLPIIYALQKAEGEDRGKLLDIYSKARVSAEDVTQVLHILNELDARTYTGEVIKQYHFRALQELELAELSSSVQRKMREVTAFLLEWGNN